jgi:hypothetical protein
MCINTGGNLTEIVAKEARLAAERLGTHIVNTHQPGRGYFNVEYKITVTEELATGESCHNHS